MKDTHASPLSGHLLLLLAGMAALGSLATNIILPTFPAMAADLGTSVKDLSATLASFFVAFALGQLFVGPLSDRYGRKPLLLGGIAVFVAGSALCAWSDNLPQLIAGRIVQALGVCATSVLSRAIARDLFQGDALARTLSLIMVAMAAAPGFSPMLGGAMSAWLGWRSTFAVLAVLALLLGMHYLASLGETHRLDRRAPLSVPAVLRSYASLLVDRRFIAPALSVSLVIGSLYMFFSMAPAILMTGFGFSPLGLSVFFASTVMVVFAAGFLAPRLARRRGQIPVARGGLWTALVGGTALLAGPHDVVYFSVAMTIFLLGMGLINPLGTAIALQHFGHQAGAASALLGFLQMMCAAAAIGLAAWLPWSVYGAFCTVLTVNLGLALVSFRGART